MSADLDLTWEWPGDRMAEQKLLVKVVEITLPRLELESIKGDDFAVIGFIASKTCICIKHVESENVDVAKVSCP